MRPLAMVLSLVAAPAMAGDAWDGLRAALWGDRPIAEGAGVVSLDAPARAADDRRVEIGAAVGLPAGRTVKAVTFIIDENPVPVSAELAMAAPLSAFEAAATFRLNGPSPVRVVVEADDGALWMAERFVKTSGQGACAAPPATDVATAMAVIGQMTLDAPDALERARGERLAALDIRHPSLSGLQMDQVTLLYAPAHFVQTVEVATDDGPLFTLTGSISLAEDPRIAFTRPDGADTLRARLEDSEGLVFERRFGLGES